MNGQSILEQFQFTVPDLVLEACRIREEAVNAEVRRTGALPYQVRQGLSVRSQFLVRASEWMDYVQSIAVGAGGPTIAPRELLGIPVQMVLDDDDGGPVIRLETSPEQRSKSRLNAAD